MIYAVKLFMYQGRWTPVLLQNENGPCPLIAIANALFLRGHIALRDRSPVSVSFDELQRILQNYLTINLNNILNSNASTQHEEKVANAIKIHEDTLALLPLLEHGLDINVRFSHASHFEYTPQLAMFDWYKLRLFHGWVCDPQDYESYSVVGHLSYNEAVNLLTPTPDPPPVYNANNSEKAYNPALASASLTTKIPHTQNSNSPGEPTPSAPNHDNTTHITSPDQSARSHINTHINAHLWTPGNAVAEVEGEPAAITTDAKVPDRSPDLPREGNGGLAGSLMTDGKTWNPPHTSRDETPKLTATHDVTRPKRTPCPPAAKLNSITSLVSAEGGRDCRGAYVCVCVCVCVSHVRVCGSGPL
jgi:hypothetical protein